jgi:hypothetical protein
MSCFCFVFSLQNLYPNSDSNAKVKIPVVGENEFRQVPTSSFNVKRGVKKNIFPFEFFSPMYEDAGIEPSRTIETLALVVTSQTL